MHLPVDNRNPPGHTFMRPDAKHGQVSRYGKSQAYVSTTRDWAERVTKECRGEASQIDSISMEQSYFRKWKCYLRQMYRSSVLITTNQETFRLLDYYWVNFGWGRRCTDGQLIHHPQEMCPIPLELAKQWDLRTLSTFLPSPVIDIWYPEPYEGDPHVVHDNLPDDDD